MRVLLILAVAVISAVARPTSGRAAYQHNPPCQQRLNEIDRMAKVNPAKLLGLK
jgi:hypothetical protein